MSTDPISFAESSGAFSFPEGELQPHRRLLMRVWWRAVCDYVLYKGCKERDQRLLADDASSWLFCEDEEQEGYGLTFLHFCDEFSLSPVRLRRWIRQLSVTEINRIGRNLP